MAVRCKFVVDRIAKTRYGTHEVSMSPVTGNGSSDENKSFWKYTPSGKLEFSTINDEAVAQFEVGREYYIDISKA